MTLVIMGLLLGLVGIVWVMVLDIVLAIGIAQGLSRASPRGS
jgi:hypothetical protein